MLHNRFVLAAAWLALLASEPAGAEGPFVAYGPEPFASPPSSPPASTAYPEGDFYQHLATASGDTPDACPYHWGDGGSPFRTGPGLCDTFRVGRRWRSRYEGLFLFREETDLAALIGAANAGGVALPNDASTLSSNFEHGAGAKLLLTSGWPQCKGYELQVGYEGIFGWDAGAFNPDVPPPGPLDPAAPVTQRGLTYRSSLHALEVNAVMARRESSVQPYWGVRYLRLSENLDDTADQSAPVAVPPIAGFTLVDVTRTADLNNNLIGFQLGARGEHRGSGRRFALSWSGSAGAYCNLLSRTSSLSQTNSQFTPDNPATPDTDESNVAVSTTSSGFKSDAARFAFVGEVGVSGVWRVNRCTQARLGYQALVLDGIESGAGLFLGVGGAGDDLFLHGWFAGIERRR